MRPIPTIALPTNRELVLYFLLALVFGMYVLTTPQDFSEAEDALWFAHDVEKLPLTELFHPFHFLYLPLMKVIYSLGVFERSYTLLLYADKLLGLFTLVLFYFLLKKRFGLSAELAVLGTTLLGVSYGFWRYSNTGEVYIAACLMSVSLALVSYTEEMSYRRAACSGVLGAAALLMHPINFTLVCVALPLRFLMFGKFRPLLIYVITTTLLVVLSYYAAYGSTLGQVMSESSATLETTTFLMSIPKNIIGLGTTIVSGNFLFSYPAFVSLVTSLFPGRMFQEEIFSGLKAGPVSRILPFVTLCGLAVAGMITLWIGLRHGEFRKTLFRNKNVFTTFVWLASYIAFMMIWEPGEGWIMCLVPFGCFVVPVVLEPAYRKRPAIVVTLTLLLFVHNYTGGMLLLRNKESDYIQQKSEWYTHNATEDDLILCLDKGVYEQYLRYFTKAQIINLFSLGKIELEVVHQVLNEQRGRVYATDDVLFPAQWYAQTDSNNFAAAAAFAKRVNAEFEKIVSNETGGIYMRNQKEPHSP